MYTMLVFYILVIITIINAQENIFCKPFSDIFYSCFDYNTQQTLYAPIFHIKLPEIKNMTI